MAAPSGRVTNDDIPSWDRCPRPNSLHKSFSVPPSVSCVTVSRDAALRSFLLERVIARTGWSLSHATTQVRHVRSLTCSAFDRGNRVHGHNGPIAPSTQRKALRDRCRCSTGKTSSPVGAPTHQPNTRVLLQRHLHGTTNHLQRGRSLCARKRVQPRRKLFVFTAGLVDLSDAGHHHPLPRQRTNRQRNVHARQPLLCHRLLSNRRLLVSSHNHQPHTAMGLPHTKQRASPSCHGPTASARPRCVSLACSTLSGIVQQTSFPVVPPLSRPTIVVTNHS